MSSGVSNSRSAASLMACVSVLVFLTCFFGLASFFNLLSCTGASSSAAVTSGTGVRCSSPSSAVFFSILGLRALFGLSGSSALVDACLSMILYINSCFSNFLKLVTPSCSAMSFSSGTIIS
ncbi:hypothetical protein D3C80_1450730 [compost metagenome]